jgi:GNAT superfamily N-acetyltransferase
MAGATLLEQVCDTVAGFLQLGNEVFTAEGATFVRNRNCPRRYDANHVTGVRCTTPEQIERLLARADTEFAEYGHRRFDVDPLTPAAFVARLALKDFSFSESVQLVLDGELRAAPPPHHIRLVESDADWAAYGALQAADWREATAKQRRGYAADIAAEFVGSKRLKTPAARFWLADIDAVTCAYACSWEGTSGVGMVEDLFTLPAYRHRGLATALIAHAVADIRARDVHSIVIGADTADTPKHMYAAMGFQPLLLTRQYIRHIARRDNDRHKSSRLD